MKLCQGFPCRRAFGFVLLGMRLLLNFLYALLQVYYARREARPVFMTDVMSDRRLFR